MFGIKKIEKIDNNDKNLEENKSGNIVTNDYYVIRINDFLGGTTKETLYFDAYRDINGNNVQIVNKKVGFCENMPSTEDEYLEHSKDKLEAYIKEITNKIQELQNNKISNTEYNSKLVFYEKQLKKFKNYKRSYDFDGIKSFVRLDLKGRPFIEFLRVGDYKIPLCLNLDLSTLYIPSETKIKSALEFLKRNDEKNGAEKKVVTFGQIVVIIIFVLLIIAQIYFLVKTASYPQEFTTYLTNTSGSLNEIVQKLNCETLQNISKNVSDVPNITTKVIN